MKQAHANFFLRINNKRGGHKQSQKREEEVLISVFAWAWTEGSSAQALAHKSLSAKAGAEAELEYRWQAKQGRNSLSRAGWRTTHVNKKEVNSQVTSIAIAKAFSKPVLR